MKIVILTHETLCQNDKDEEHGGKDEVDAALAEYGDSGGLVNKHGHESRNSKN